MSCYHDRFKFDNVDRLRIDDRLDVEAFVLVIDLDFYDLPSSFDKIA